MVDIPSSVNWGRPRSDTPWDNSVVLVAYTRSSRIAKTFQVEKERHTNVYVDGDCSGIL